MQNLEKIKHKAELIVKWADDRGILDNPNYLNQACKLTEEIGEATGAIAKGKDLNKIKDGIGDAFVVLTILRAMKNAGNVKEFLKNAESKTRLFKNILVGNHNVILMVKIQQIAILTHEEPLDSDFDDVFYILDFIAQNIGLSLLDCVDYAYNEIKDRKGRMINGVFVKEADLKK